MRQKIQGFLIPFITAMSLLALIACNSVIEDILNINDQTIAVTGDDTSAFGTEIGFSGISFTHNTTHNSYSVAAAGIDIDFDLTDPEGVVGNVAAIHVYMINGDIRVVLGISQDDNDWNYGSPECVDEETEETTCQQTGVTFNISNRTITFQNATLQHDGYDDNYDEYGSTAPLTLNGTLTWSEDDENVHSIAPEEFE